ncbi:MULTISPECIES: Cthe_2314 family HEPN domain-containing protein [unclassified Lysobacter]|uniref:Cthe_2314 family HEPN domain-containing protein n=1 Tax=unclassified Lysobacter TaxID=2635362 RepID=UPI0006FCACC2|nr:MULTISPECIES: Cthe_2314 family HEPN domain-containing protein [unclassified Lysobacter]KRC38084.1 hypothetical protein ASE10_00360 [Lysobacter sp. Root76]KRD69409.1 hypothetical protein ASE45_09650 [Lysobacter sp. Root96]
MNIDDLKTHKFVTECWNDSMGMRRKHKELGIDPMSDSVNELEFYTYRVGHALAHLLTWIEQLQEAPTYLADFNYSGKARKSGITRARYLLYTVENYLIRLQSIYDRCLQLTNCVFHLCIEDSNVGHSLVVSNLQVSRTDIPSHLKRVRKAVAGKQSDRNKIVHQASYQEKELDRLLLFYIYDESTWDEAQSGTPFKNLAIMRSQLLRKVVAEKRSEFEAINTELFEAIGLLLDKFLPHYRKHVKKVSTYVSAT